MNKTIRILYVDDSAYDRELVRDALEKEAGGFIVTEAISRSDFEAKFANGLGYDLVLSDFNILGFDGLQVLEVICAVNPYLPVIIVTGTGSEEIAVEAIKRGAADYVIKSTSHIQRLSQTILQVLSNSKLETERRQALVALRDSEERFRFAFEQAAIGMCMVTIDGVFLRVNQSFWQMVGYSEQELLGRNISQITYPEDIAESDAFFKESIKKELKTVQYEQRYVHKDGHLIWVSVSTSLVCNLVNEPQYFINQIQNTSERKQAEKMLEEERNLFQVLMNNIPDGIYFKDLKSRFIRINQAQAKNFGLTDSALSLGKTDFDYFAEQHARPAYNDEQRIIRTGQPLIDKEEEEKCLDGRTGWVSTTKMPLRNNAGQIIGTFGISRDITRRKQMELSLQQRLLELETVNQLSGKLRAGKTVQELLQILLDETLKTMNTQDGGIFLFNPSTNKLELTVSRGWFDQLAGLILDTNEGINGHVFTTKQPYFTSEMQNDQFLAQKVKNLIPAKQFGGFFPVQCSEGIIGVLDVYVPYPRIITENEQRLLTIISQLAGNATLRSRLHERLNVTNMDLQNEINQRTKVQDMLAAEKELLSTTLMSIAEGVIITDKEGIVILYNRAAELITGNKAVEVINQPLHKVFQLIDPNTHELISDLINSLFEMDRLQATDPNYKSPLLITKSGVRILASGSISSLSTPGGEMMGYVLVFQNITERYKANIQTALSQKMEAIGQLAAGIAHEINTPIQYVGDNLRFLQKTVSRFSETLDAYQKLILEADKPLSQADIDQIELLKRQNKIQHYLQESPTAVQEALDGVERVRKIVLAMREFSHPSEKGKNLSDINHGIETTVVISHNEWKYCAELDTDLDPELPKVNCQIDEINQVVLNMIVNAAQSIQEKIPAGSDQKGKITIQTRKTDTKVLIIIQDTGMGIPEAIQQRIFDPFFTTKGVGKGTGQGLSLAHNIIVKKHQGRILIDSTVGKGTNFTIELPIDSLIQET